MLPTSIISGCAQQFGRESGCAPECDGITYLRRSRAIENAQWHAARLTVTMLGPEKLRGQSGAKTYWMFQTTEVKVGAISFDVR